MGEPGKNWMQTMATKFLDTKAAAQHLGLKKSTLDAWRSRGEGPRFLKLGRAVRYRQIDLDTWIESRVRQNTIKVAG